MAIDFNKMKKKAAQLDKESQKGVKAVKTRWLKFKPGKNRIRIMPPWTTVGANSDQFFREVHLHWNVGGDGTKENPGYTFTCPKYTPGDHDKACPICDEGDRLRKTKDQDDFEAAKKFRARKSYYSNVVDLEDAVFTLQDLKDFKESYPDKDVPFQLGETKVKVVSYGTTLFKDLLDHFSDGDDLSSLESGRDLTVTREGVGRFDTEYRLKLDKNESEFSFKGNLSTGLYNLDLMSPFSETEKMSEALSKVDSSFDPFVSPKQAISLSRTPASVSQSRHDVPECFKDALTYNSEDPECRGGVKNGAEFDRCPVFDECSAHCNKLKGGAMKADLSELDALTEQLKAIAL